MKIEYLREFLLIAETLNLTEAASKLYTTQPVLSRHIHAIEDEVGAQLIARDTHGMELTGAGEMACREFSRIVSIYDGVIEKASRMSTSSSGALSVGVPYYFIQFSDNVFPPFWKKFPDIDVNPISFQPSFAYDALLKDEIDLALLFRHDCYPNSDQVRFHDFATEQLVAVMSSENPLASNDSIKWSDLKGETIISFRHNYFSDFIQQRLRMLGVKPAAYTVSDNIDTLVYTIAETGGIAIEPISVENMKRSKIAFIPISDDMGKVATTLAYRTDNSNPTIPVFLKFVDSVYPKLNA
ncbi:MAG: LysR family transcriptional regulator [Coriobacteriales bacterium]|jgi:DNA-binding transcriptional LysR family regulator